MMALIDALSWAALVAGAAFYAIGAIGLNRMPDVFTRMHAVSVSDTLGLGLLMLGMLLQAGFTLVAVKLIFITLIVWTTGAVASHALARAALHDGEKPLIARSTALLEKTDCVDLFPELGVRLATPISSETVEDLDRVQPPLPAEEMFGEGYGLEPGVRVNPDADPGVQKREDGSSNS